MPNYADLSWQERGLLDFEHIWIDLIPDEWRSVLAALHELRGKEIILIVEAMFFGIMPLFYGAPVPGRKPTSLCVSVTVPFIKAEGLGPAFLNVEGEQGWKVWDRCTRDLNDGFKEKLKEAGCTREVEGEFLSGQNYTGHDRILQLGVGGMFERRKWPERFRFVGVLPKKGEPVGGWKVPNWWADVKGERKVVVVAQGTVEVDPADLILPTLRAMEERKDVLVVAILGRRGATLPERFVIPANARVADYLAYEAILPWASAWVHNGGYGAVQHGIAHGVPMVVAGEGQDKTENAKLVEFSGSGVNLGRVPPPTEDVRRAIDTVLDDMRFRARVKALSDDSAQLDCFEAIEKDILDSWQQGKDFGTGS